MADSVDDQLYELTRQINRLVKVFGGDGQSPFSSPGTSKAKAPMDNLAKTLHRTNKSVRGMGWDGVPMGKFAKTLHHTHTAVKGMHGGVDDLLYSLKTLSSNFGALSIGIGAVTALFAGAMQLSKTYSKMTDIGERFGGSMLSMAQQAGQAGLSLQEFADLQSRNSVLTMMMNDTIVNSAKSQETSTSTFSDSIERNAASLGVFQTHAQQAGTATGDLGAAHGDLGATLTSVTSSQALMNDAALKLNTGLLGLMDSSQKLTGANAASGKSAALMAAKAIDTNVALNNANVVSGRSASLMASAAVNAGASMDKLAGANVASGQSTSLMAIQAAGTNAALDGLIGTTKKETDQKNSVIADNIKHQASDRKSSASTLAELQLGVRNDLEQFGFFGMALGELTNATSDYMETLREGGMLYRLDNVERKHAVETMLSDVSTMSAVWGKSREAIMKTTNEAMRQVNFAVSMMDADKSRVEAGEKWITMFAAIPGASGDKLAAMFAEQAGRGGYIDTELGKGFIETGMGNLNAIFGRGTDMLAKGIAPSAEIQGGIMKDAYNELSANKERLQLLTHDPAMKKQAEEQLRLLSDMQGKFTKMVNGVSVFDEEKYILAQQDAEKNKKHMDILTKNMLVFTSSFQKITGGFLDGFYGALADMMGGGDSQTFKDTLEYLHAAFVKLGRGVGTVLGILMSPTSLSVLTLIFSWFNNLVTVVSTVIEGLSKFSNKLMEFVDYLRNQMPAWMGLGKKPVERNADNSIKNNAQLAQELHDMSAVQKSALQIQAKDTSNPAAQKEAQAKLAEMNDLDKKVASYTAENTQKLMKQASASNPDEKSRQDAQEKIAYNAKNPPDFDWDAFTAAQSEKDRTSITGVTESVGVVVGGLVAIKVAKTFLGFLTGKAASLFRMGGKKGAVGEILSTATGMGNGCCNNMTNGLGDIAKKIDEHGGAAAENAGKALKQGEKAVAETVAETAAKKLPLGERMAHGVMGAGHAVIDAVKGGASAVYHGIGSAADAILDLPSTVAKGAGYAKSAVKSGAKSVIGGVTGFGMKAIGTVTKGIAGVASKGILKGIGSMIPGIGLVMGGVFATQRALQGDFLGAGMEMVGGVASLVPGIGTAIDVAMQGALLTRDLLKTSDTDKDKKAADGTPLDVTPNAPHGTVNPDNPGENQTEAEGALDRLNTMRTDMIDQSNMDKADGNLAGAADDDNQIKKMSDGIDQLVALMKKSNKEQADSNQADIADRARAIIAGIQ